MNRFFTLLLAASCASASSQESCPPPLDVNQDGVIGITDVLNILSVFGDSDMDFDGVWDSVDDCVGAYDECGFCNGPGPTTIVVEDITTLYDSVYVEQIDEWLVFEVGADTTFSITCGIFEECGDPLHYQGYDYWTVLIGEQCWFADNLRSQNYNNGDVIPSNLNEAEWTSTNSGATTFYPAPDGSTYLVEYGRLYNAWAVSDPRGLCPAGWHVPTDDEWTELTDFLGGSTYAGTPLKASSDDSPGWNGTNQSRFSGLPGGVRDAYEGFDLKGPEGGPDFSGAGGSGTWWSSTPSINQYNLWTRRLSSSSSVFRIDRWGRYGYSVRCIQGAE